MPQFEPHSTLAPFGRLLGAWETECPHFSGRRGRTEFEWLEGGAYLLVRSHAPAPNPTGTWIIGPDESATSGSALYHDQRGVSRVYESTFVDGVWKLWRNVPGFTQRFTGTLSPDGRRIEGTWEMSDDGTEWRHDFDLIYTRTDETAPQPDLQAIARTIVDTNRYLTLGTGDEHGAPWASPVWYAPSAYREFFWVSSPAARHSRNIATRPQISLVIFDSRAPIGTGQGVYMSALAEAVADADIERCMEIFSARSLAQGSAAWTADDVRPPAHLRLYQATVTEQSVLDSKDQRQPVHL
ncbi:MAG: pyridoxamine 5'-phosphate oxidase family protein [Candidatus Dormiibacterota bacterium]